MSLAEAFFPRCISVWNHLSPEIKDSENVNLFKRGIKSYLWNLALNGYDTDSSEESYTIEPD